MQGVSCEITSCLRAIPDVRSVCDVCTLIQLDPAKISLSLILVVSFLAFGQLLNVAMTDVWFKESLFWQGFYISPRRDQSRDGTHLRSGT